MITSEINIWEIDRDGPPEEPGVYVFWLEDGDMAIIDVTDNDLAQFEQKFDGNVWTVNAENCVAYCKQEYLELGYI